MMKKIFSKETYMLQFTEEAREKVTDFLFDFTGLTDISEVVIKPYGMYIERLDNFNPVEKSVENSKPQTIYCGTEDYVDFFYNIISTLGIDLDYEVKVIDGEYEIIIKGVK